MSDRPQDPADGRDDDLWSRRPDPFAKDPYAHEQPGPEPTAPYRNPYEPAGSSPPPSYGAPYQPPGQYGPPTPYGAYGPPSPGYAALPPNDGLGVAAMVVGIVSLVLMCGYGVGLLGSPVALFMGRASMRRIDRSGGQLGGRGMAQAGFILGIIGTVLLVLVVIAVAVGVFALFRWGDVTTGTSTGTANM